MNGLLLLANEIFFPGVDEIRSKIQLSSLRVVDPDACSVVEYAGRTALYGYSQNDETWSKTDVEGTL